MISVVVDGKQLYLARIYDSIKPVLFCCKMVGVFPITTVKEGNGIILSFAKKDLLQFTLLFLVSIILLLYNIKLIVNDEIDMYMPKAFLLTYLLGNALAAFIMMGFGFWNRKTIRDYLINIAEIDYYFYAVGVNINYDSIRFKSVFCLTLILSLYSARNLSLFLMPEIPFIHIIISTYIPLSKTFILFMYSALTLMAYDRFEIINNAIASCEQATSNSNTHFLATKVYTLSRCHYKLHKLTKNMNIIFGLQLLIIIAMALINYMLLLYFMYQLFLKTVTVAKPIKILAVYFWFAAETLEIMGLIIICYGTSKQCNYTGVSLHKMLRQAQDKDVIKDVQAYSLQILHQKLHFSALGLIDIDYSLYYTMFGTCISFVLVLADFENNE